MGSQEGEIIRYEEDERDDGVARADEHEVNAHSSLCVAKYAVVSEGTSRYLESGDGRRRHTTTAIPRFVRSISETQYMKPSVRTKRMSIRLMIFFCCSGVKALMRASLSCSSSVVIRSRGASSILWVYSDRPSFVSAMMGGIFSRKARRQTSGADGQGQAKLSTESMIRGASLKRTADLECYPEARKPFKPIEALR